MSRRNQTRNPALRGLVSRWLVHEGRPSWHQARAGHISAGATVFSGDDAQPAAIEYASRAKLRHPDEHYAVREERSPILEGK